MLRGCIGEWSCLLGWASALSPRWCTPSALSLLLQLAPWGESLSKSKPFLESFWKVIPSKLSTVYTARAEVYTDSADLWIGRLIVGKQLFSTQDGLFSAGFPIKRLLKVQCSHCWIFHNELNTISLLTAVPYEGAWSAIFLFLAEDVCCRNLSAGVMRLFVCGFFRKSISLFWTHMWYSAAALGTGEGEAGRGWNWTVWGDRPAGVGPRDQGLVSGRLSTGPQATGIFSAPPAGLQRREIPSIFFLVNN